MAKVKKTPVIIDVDTGIDDAVALSIALVSKKLEILLVTTGAGNSGVDQATENTLNILNFFKHSEIPVAKGEPKPLYRDIAKYSVHGNDGMGNCSHMFPKRETKAIEKVAHEAMAETILACDKKVTLIALGPLTNIAKLLMLHPEVKENIEEIILMAGSTEICKEGELPYAGFNVKVDPEACEYVINSGVKLVINPCDMGHIAYLDYQEVYKTKNTNMAGKFFEQVFRTYKDHHVKNGIAMHDSCAVAYVIDPSLFKVEKLFVHVQYYKQLGTGVLRCEWKEPKNIDVCTQCNIKRFKRLYFKSLKRVKTIDD